MESSPTPITIQALTKRFGATTAVDNIDLAIPAGSLFFLLGPSGCGKTTLLRMIAGFAEPTEGRLLFGEDDVTSQPPNQRNAGMVFQGYALWPHMTVRDNVAFGLDVRKVGKQERLKRVDEALKGVQMAHLADRKPNQLSGGQQQRVALARALVIQPRVLLLDEPLSNLDAKLRIEMRSTIKDICKAAGTTAVYVTHDQKEALSMADQIAVLRAGQLMQRGTPKELYQRPSNRFVADFLGETNFIAAEVVEKQEGRVILECPAGRLSSTVFPEDLPASGSVSCSISPEAVRLHWGEQAASDAGSSGGLDDGLNRFPAEVQTEVYLGETAQHALSIGQGLNLRAFELNPRYDQQRNGQLSVSFDPGDVVVLKD